MDKSTVTKIISALTELHLVKETESGESGPQGGRKPVFLEIDGNTAATGGIEINSERMYCTLLDLQGNTLFEKNIEITPASYSEKGFIGFFKEGAELLKGEAEKFNLQLAGIGLGIPGMVNLKTGQIVQSIPLMIMEPVNIVREAAAFTDIPVFFDNDARCCCYTEHMISDAPVIKNTLYIMAEYRKVQPVENSPRNLSIGLGLVINGKIFHGSNSAAGEFRSILWKSGSPTQFSTGTDFLTSLESEEAAPMFKELSQNIALLVNTLALDAVYVGGIEKKYADEIVKYIREEIVYLWPYEWNKTALVTTATISDSAVSFGAASMVLDKLFSVPELSAEKTDSDKEESGFDYLARLSKKRIF